MMNHNRKTRSPTKPMAGGARDGVLTAVVTGVALSMAKAYGVELGADDIALVMAGVGATSGAVVGVGKSVRDFRSSGQGGFGRWLVSWVFCAALMLVPSLGWPQQPSEVKYTEPDTSAENDLGLIRLFIVSKATGLAVHRQDYPILDGDLDGTQSTPAGGTDRRQPVNAPVLAPGDYDVHLVAVDLAGNASLPSNMLTYTVEAPDTTPDPPVLKEIAKSLERMATALEQIASTRVVVMTEGN